MDIQRILNKEDFEPNINTIFKLIDSEEKTIELKLFEIQEKDQKEIYTFTLLLEGPADTVAYDDTYKFLHDTIGEFAMFISPYQKIDDKILYEAIFSRLKN